MATSTTKPPIGRAITVNGLLSIYLPALILALGAGAAVPAIPALAKSFGVGFGLASGVITAFLLGNLVSSLPTGWLLDRVGPRSIILTGPLLTAVFSLLAAFTHSFSVLLLLRFADGCAAQMWIMARLAMISRSAAPHQRGRQVTWMFGMDNAGKLAGPILGGLVAAQWGPRAPFVGYSAFAVLALVAALIFKGENSHKVARIKRSETRRVPIRSLIESRLPYFGIAFFSGLARGPVQADLLHIYVAFTYHLGPKQIGYIAAGSTLLSLPIGFLCGWLMDRYGRRQTMVPGFLGIMIAMAALAASTYTHSSIQWYLALFMAGVALQALTTGSVQTVGVDVAPDEGRGAFLGLWRFVGQGGLSLSPIAFAALAGWVNYGSAFLFISLSAGATGLLLMRQKTL